MWASIVGQRVSTALRERRLRRRPALLAASAGLLPLFFLALVCGIQPGIFVSVIHHCRYTLRAATAEAHVAVFGGDESCLEEVPLVLLLAFAVACTLLGGLVAPLRQYQHRA